MALKNGLVDILTTLFGGWKWTTQPCPTVFANSAPLQSVPVLAQTPDTIFKSIASSVVDQDPLDATLLTVSKSYTAGTTGNLAVADYAGTGKAFINTGTNGATGNFGIHCGYFLGITNNVASSVALSSLTATLAGYSQHGLAISKRITWGPQNIDSDRVVCSAWWLPSVTVLGQDHYVPFAYRNNWLGTTFAEIGLTSDVASVTAPPVGTTFSYELGFRGHREVNDIVTYVAMADKWVADWAWQGRRVFDTVAASGVVMLNEAGERTRVRGKMAERALLERSEEDWLGRVNEFRERVNLPRLTVSPRDRANQYFDG